MNLLRLYYLQYHKWLYINNRTNLKRTCKYDDLHSYRVASYGCSFCYSLVLAWSFCDLDSLITVVVWAYMHGRSFEGVNHLVWRWRLHSREYRCLQWIIALQHLCYVFADVNFLFSIWISSCTCMQGITPLLLINNLFFIIISSFFTIWSCWWLMPLGI